MRFLLRLSLFRASIMGVLVWLSAAGTSSRDVYATSTLPRLSLSWPVGLAIDRSGQVYVSDNQNNRILKLSGTGRLLAEWPLRLLDASDNFVHSPMATDSRGNVYIANGYTNQLFKFSPSGRLLTMWQASTKWMHRCGFISGFALDARDAIYLSTEDNVTNGCHAYVLKISPRGQLLARWHVGDSARSIAVDDRGTMFIPYEGKTLPVECCDAVSHAHYGLTELLPSGKVRARIPLGTFSSTDLAVALDGAGGFWLTNTAANAVSRRLPNGRWAFNHTTDADCISTLCSPESIAITRAGEAIVTDTLNNRIVVLSATGRVQAIWN